jgi:hypothetical protein
MQNIYDNAEFFKEYSQMRRSQDGLGAIFPLIAARP